MKWKVLDEHTGILLVRNLDSEADRKAAMLGNGGGLWFQLTRGEKGPDHIRSSWGFRYTYLGRTHDLGLGGLHSLDLAEERAKAKALRRQLLDHVDPLAAKQQIKREQLAQLAAQQHAVPLSPQAQQLLQRIRRGQGEAEVFVFPSSGESGHVTTLKKSWREICKAAGIANLRLHDLRHSYASFAINAGWSLPVIGALLGHTQPSTTHRYAHLVDDVLARQ
jgi:hypothetical protein